MKFCLTIVFVAIVFLGNGQKIHFKKANDGFWVMEDDDKVMFFQRKENDSIPSLSRNNYFHPVYDLNGNVITEDFPKDHPHQRGLFWAWHELLIDGEKVADQWDIDNFKQKVKNIEFQRGNENQGYFSYQSVWYADETKPVKLMQESTYVTICPRSESYRRIDFEIGLRALAYGLQLGGEQKKKGYGGFSIRMKTDDETEFHDRNGVIQPKLTGIDAGSYVDITNKKMNSGVTIISWPGNPESYNWILRQKNSMQNCAWPGNILVDIPVDKQIILRYSIFIHNGNMKEVPVIPTLNDLVTLNKQLEQMK